MKAGRTLSSIHHQKHYSVHAHEEEAGGFNVHEDLDDLIDDEPDPRARQLLEDSVAFLYRSGESAEIEVEYLLDYLDSRRRHYVLCTRMPFTVAIFAVFTNMVLWHEDLASQGLLQRFVRGMMSGTTYEGVQFTSGHKTFYDVQSVEDVYTFLREALLPLVLPADPAEVLRSGSPAELHRALRYNRLIGGVQLQQKRWRTVQCADNFDGYETTQAVVGGATCFSRAGVDDCYGPLAFGVRVPNLRALLPSGFCGDSSSEGYGQLFYAPPPEDGGSGANASGAARRLGPPSARRRARGLAAARGGAADERGGASRPRRRSRRAGGARQGARQGGRQGGREGAEARRLRMSASHQNARAVTRHSPAMNPSIISLPSDTYSVMLTEEAGMPGALEKLDWLEGNQWIDVQTQWVGINLFMLNPELSIYVHATANIYSGTSGEWVPHLSVNTFHAEPYANMSTIAIDVIFLVLIMSAVCMSWGQIFHSLLHAKLKVYFKVPYHWVRLAVGHGGLAIALLWVLGYGRLTTVKDQAVAVTEWLTRTLTEEQASQIEEPQAAEAVLANVSEALLANGSLVEAMGLATMGDRPEYVRLLLDMHREVQAFTEFVMLYRVAIAAYGVLLLLGFFRLFQMQPRLAMVVNTLRKSWKDVAHHMVVFMMLWMAFTVSGMLIFSRTVYAFGQLGEAISKTFTIMLGDLDWEELSKDSPTLAAAWLWIFLSMMMLLMLNMLMAIVMDVYAEVKAEACEVEPIWSQLRTMLKDWTQDRDEIGPRALERILKRLSKRQEIKKISAKLLAHIVPGMRKEQAVSLVSGALQLREANSGMSMTLTQMHQMIGRIRIQVGSILERSTAMECDMRAQQQENREMAKRRRAEAARRAEELSRIQSVDRWEHSRRFQRRTKAIEEKLARGETLVQDAVAWLGYRGRQVDEDVAKIERLARMQAPRPRAASHEPSGGRVLATLLGVPSSSSAGGGRARQGGRIAQEPPRFQSPPSSLPSTPSNKTKEFQSPPGRQPASPSNGKAEPPPPTDTLGSAQLLMPPPAASSSSAGSRLTGRSASVPPRPPSLSLGSARPPLDLEAEEEMPVPRLRTTGTAHSRLERIDSGELLEHNLVKARQPPDKAARGSRPAPPNPKDKGSDMFSV